MFWPRVRFRVPIARLERAQPSRMVGRKEEEVVMVEMMGFKLWLVNETGLDGVLTVRLVR